ncbi:BamA/TamA family outer membrane protein [Chitinophaga japonensis]|uniref:Calcineurin-like phosphoesterase family protein n=1 Tax=Chitinophaga japonensis TaxID=104662 RepID=A0A562TGF9_CHIJA|nr:BamA/TamA family outer membrane protein [Chitinophaga japonensis]TWI92413.1 calcineurin-like phosphoesterase family protein [Chitinophaga japonensis]
MLRSILLLCITASLSGAAHAQTDSVLHRIILIGDAGELHKNGHNPVVDAVRQRYNLQDARNTVLYLGDNVYPYGLPDEAASSYPEAKEILDYQVNLVRGTATQAIFIPGNHDWHKQKPEGWQIIKNEQRYVDSLHLPNVRFLPKDGCPGPVEVPLTDSITLIVMDSEWWLFPYEKPGAGSSCECKDKEEVITALSDIVSRNRGKLLLFASHHPFRSHGIHGGYYTIKQHIFPFTDLKPHLYIPLPVLGSIYPLARGVFGAREDIPHPEYQQMIKRVEETFEEHGPTVFVAGHDHALQLLKDGEYYYIVSGSGAKHDRVKKGKHSLFATYGNGFSALELLRDGTLRVQYYLADQLDQPVYASRLFNLKAIRQAAVAGSTPASTLPPFVKMAADTQYNDAGKAHRFWLGDNYRAVWDAPLSFPVLDLHKEKGGLHITKRGGGMQTRSLRLEDPNGKEWVLRSLKKDPRNALPEEFRETFARDVVQDQISASNPYAPTVVAALAEAAGIPHTNPTFVYLPRDTALGIYENDFGGDVYLFEEREPVEKGIDTDNTEKVLDELQGDNDTKIDQTNVLHARLLDMVMGDWDRHDDQWRWGEIKKKKRKEYFPIPRDRDQAFFVNDGVLPWLAARRWLMPKFQGFKDHYPDINGFNFNARYFDRSFMNGLSEKQWQEHAQLLTQQLTDSVLQAAVRRFPDTVRAMVGNTTFARLKGRRDGLEEAALKYYRFLARDVDIPGTRKNELFTIEKQPEGRLAVNVRKISKGGDLEQTIYSRIFDPADTREIRLYSLGGDDRFVISGDHRSPIRIRLVGGKDPDTYIDSSTAGGKKLRIYDLKHGKDSFMLSHGAQKRLSHHPDVIRYNRMAFKYNKLMPLVTAGYNLDDGILLGLGFQYTGHGFRKEPFAVRHTFTAGHSVATSAYQFHYRGEFTDAIGNTDLELEANARAPHNTVNFFGLGNESVFDRENRDIWYYRSRYNLYGAEALLKSKLASRVRLFYGPSFSSYALDTDENDDRYVSKLTENGLDSIGVYATKQYAGLRVGLQIDTRNNEILPSRGMLWTTSLFGNQGLNEEQHHYLRLQSDMSIYTSFRVPASFVIVTRFGGGVIWGHYEFFQAMMLGGVQNLRGYRNNRFAGRSMVYNNTELRLKLFQFRSYLFPASVGLLAFNDIGRVWIKGEDSGVWHDGFGGGFYCSPVNMFIITATLGSSTEGVQPYVTFGFKF